MPAFNVQETIELNAPAATVRAALQNYNTWAIWSPWLHMEPDASLTMEGTASTVGHAYSWDGDTIGSGRMQLAQINDTTDQMDLTFLRPFKSTAKVEFDTTAIDASHSRVKWRMDSSLPFFLFFMKGTMESMISMDYQRGLKLFKEYIETGDVTSATKSNGVVEVPTIYFTGVDASCSLSDIASSMESTFSQLKNVTQEPPAFYGAIYHDMNIKTQHCQYTGFASVNPAPANQNAGQTEANDHIPACKALKVTHTGSYRHLGNAWSTIYNIQRNKKHKMHKQIAPFEIYKNDPAVVPASELVTEIYIPLKN